MRQSASRCAPHREGRLYKEEKELTSRLLLPVFTAYKAALGLPLLITVLNTYSIDHLQILKLLQH